MIDVFVRWWPQNRIRLHLGEAVLRRLALEVGTLVTIIEPKGCQFPPSWGLGTRALADPARFPASAREKADKLAQSDVYVVIDDDHMPIGVNWLERGVAALRARDDYAMLSAWSVNGEVRDPGSELRVLERGFEIDPEVFSAVSAGCPCFVRKGTFAKCPDAPAPEYDLVLSEHLKANVGKIGFLRHVRYNHLGYELSQVVPGHWLAP